jgi:hypothetical protein
MGLARACGVRRRIQPVDVNAQIGDNRPSCTETKRARWLMAAGKRPRVGWDGPNGRFEITAV